MALSHTLGRCPKDSRGLVIPTKATTKATGPQRSTLAKLFISFLGEQQKKVLVKKISRTAHGPAPSENIFRKIFSPSLLRSTLDPQWTAYKEGILSRFFFHVLFSLNWTGK